MDSRRLHYLRALDIDVWQRRDRPVEQPRVSSSTLATVMPPVDVIRPAPQVVAKAIVPPIPILEPARTTSLAQLVDPQIAAMDWETMVGSVASCTRCALHTTRTQSVFGVGNRNASWMVIGEAPGAEEDRQGEPFVGKAGQLLNQMLRAIGLEREQVFIANILKSRPPSNRDP